jgi:hypothetical protein
MMRRSLPLRRFLRAAFLAAVCFAAGVAPAANAASSAQIKTAQAQLATPTVRPALPTPGYDRGKFPHWAPRPALGTSCDVRDAILIRDGSAVRFDANCTAISGSWRDPALR